MKCLHGEPAASSTTENGTFVFCAQSPSCTFFCPQDAGYLFKKATESYEPYQLQPVCNGHGKLALACCERCK